MRHIHALIVAVRPVVREGARCSAPTIRRGNMLAIHSGHD
jgi:hypothetical protein